MDCYDVHNSSTIKMQGGKQLCGELRIQGSKNAALPLLAASILVNGTSSFINCPNITDVDCMIKLLRNAGAKVERGETALNIDSKNIVETHMPSKYASAMRSSVVLLGAMLGRLGEAYIDYPGGCVIGNRPIDLHIYALKKLGACFEMSGNHIHSYAKKLIGNRIVFPFSSVGATQNAILAAVYADGTTIIENAAREPEITVLCDFLNKAGADIRYSNDFIKNGIIVINGKRKDSLHGLEYTIVSDRIVAGTYLMSVMATGGWIKLYDAPIKDMDSILEAINSMGGKLTVLPQNSEIILEVLDRSKINNLKYIETSAYPGFPTDMQSQLMVVACLAKGKLIIKETVFSNRFKIVDELQRMGAGIDVINKNEALILGSSVLEGRNIIAKELRGGAALVIAGLAADGITIISDAKYIRRGYEDIVGDFVRLGARISYD